MPSLGGWEFVILIGILVLLFGAKRLPDMARSVGQSARVFKGELKGLKNDEEKHAPRTATDAQATPSTAQQAPAPASGEQASQPAQQQPVPEPGRTAAPGDTSR